METSCYCCNAPIIYPAKYYSVITGGYLCESCEEERESLAIAAKLDEHLSAACKLMPIDAEDQTKLLQRFFGEDVVGDPEIEAKLELAKETIAKADSIEAMERSCIERLEEAHKENRELARKLYDIRHAAQSKYIKGLGKKLTRVLELCN